MPVEGEEDSLYLCLRLLNEWGAFEQSEAIEDVSGQASGEASLETMLKKVRRKIENCSSLTVRYCWLS